MHSFVKHLFIAVALAFLCGTARAQLPAIPAASPSATPTSSLMKMIPLPVGETSKGFRYTDIDAGKKKMFLNVDELKRIDAQHVQMTNSKIITYDENGAKDFTLLLPDSVLDLITRALTSSHPFVLQRSNLEMMGDTLELDTAGHKAKVTGKTIMVIYNVNDLATKGTAHE